MEENCIRSVGISREEYEIESERLIDSLKNIREEILKLDESPGKYNLLLDLLIAIDGLLVNKEYFNMNLLLSISKGEKHTAITFYESSELEDRIYGDVNKLPTYCIIANDLKSFYFVKEKDVLHNINHEGRKSNYEVSFYTIKDGIVDMKIIRDIAYAYKIDHGCLYETEELVSEFQKKLVNN